MSLCYSYIDSSGDWRTLEWKIYFVFGNLSDYFLTTKSLLVTILASILNRRVVFSPKYISCIFLFLNVSLLIFIGVYFVTCNHSFLLSVFFVPHIFTISGINIIVRYQLLLSVIQTSNFPKVWLRATQNAL